MKLKKLLSVNVGTHHHEQALIFTEQGEIFMTTSTETSQGFALVPFVSKQLLRGLLHEVLTTRRCNGVVDCSPDCDTLHVSPAANCFKLCGYNHGAAITRIEGGHDLQTITIIGNGKEIVVKPSEQIELPHEIRLDSPIKSLVLRKEGNVWRKLF